MANDFYKNEIYKKQTAKKGFVIEAINNELTKSFIFTRQNISNVRSELECYVEILEKVLIDKLGVSPSAIDEVKREINLRNTKDNELFNKFWGDKEKTEIEKIELMRTNGLSDKAYFEMKKNFELKNVPRNPLPASENETESTEVNEQK